MQINFKSEISKGDLSIMEKRKWLEGEAFKQKEVDHVDFISDITKVFENAWFQTVIGSLALPLKCGFHVNNV